MKKIYSKFLTGAILFFLVVCSTANKGHSQFLGLYTYWYNDSISSGNVCLTDSVYGYVYWSNSGTYVPGDYVDFNINWGDGNNDPYLNVPITPSPSTGTAGPIYPSHTYAAVGNYMVIVSAVDNYANAFADTFYFDVSTNCGRVFVHTYLDDGDGVLDFGDFPVSGVDLQLTSGGPSYYGYTSAYGSLYLSSIDITQPSYNLEVDPSWLSSTGISVIDPVAGNYNLTGLNGTTQFYNFLLDCGSSSYMDASIYGWGWGFRPAMNTGYVNLYVNNSSCPMGSATGDVSLDFDPMMTVYSSYPAGATVSAGNITWSGSNLPAGYTYFTVNFTVPAGTPAGTPLAFLANVNPTSATDANSANNNFAFNSEVRNSWDPNDKSTNVEHFIDVNTQDEIYYTIRFQNMGNAEAIDIHIDDTISNLLDLSSFRLISMSHSGSYSIDPASRKVVFTFPNINLVPQSFDEELSQGYVMYSIKENAGLPVNSDIQNTAHIFFDSNPAVVTNTTSNVNIANVGIEGESPLSSVTAYPVPANSIVYIGGINPQDITGLKILDMSGKVIQVINQNMASGFVSVSEISNGFYLLEITSGNISTVRKICVQH